MQARLYPCLVLLPEGRAREASLVAGAGHGLAEGLATFWREAQAARRVCPQLQARLTRGAPPELTIGRFASPVRLKEPCARAASRSSSTHSIEPDASRATPRSTFRLVPQGSGPKAQAL